MNFNQISDILLPSLGFAEVDVGLRNQRWEMVTRQRGSPWIRVEIVEKPEVADGCPSAGIYLSVTSGPDFPERRDFFSLSEPASNVIAALFTYMQLTIARRVDPASPDAGLSVFREAWRDGNPVLPSLVRGAVVLSERQFKGGDIAPLHSLRVLAKHRLEFEADEIAVALKWVAERQAELAAQELQAQRTSEPSQLHPELAQDAVAAMKGLM